MELNIQNKKENDREYIKKREKEEEIAEAKEIIIENKIDFPTSIKINEKYLRDKAKKKLDI